jgi:predicted MFS family arabinose efflux permease
VAFPALAALAMAEAKPDDAGLASGVFNKTAHVGSELGLAVLAPLSAGGYRLALLVASALVLAALTVTITVIRPATEPTEPTEPENAETPELLHV